MFLNLGFAGWQRHGVLTLTLTLTHGTGNKASGSLSGNKKTQEEREEEERKEQAAREATSLLKKEELAKKRAEKSAKHKNKRTRTGNAAVSVYVSSGVTISGKMCTSSSMRAAKRGDGNYSPLY